jgi:hypothetical protein
MFGSGVSREPYKSLDQFFSCFAARSQQILKQRLLPVPEPVLSNSTCWYATLFQPNYKLEENGLGPTFFWKWKKTLIF